MTQVELDELKQVVERLVGEDRQFAIKERRSIIRQPFCRPATLRFHRGQAEPLAACVRDISERGIGLVHDFPIEPGRLALLAIHRLWDEPIVFRCEIRWCENWGPGWYISGWQVISIESE